MEHVHSLCLIEGNDNKGYPELYDKISQYASQNYAVIYAVEEDTTQAVRHMSRHGAEVEALVESGALTIVGRNSMYSIEKTELEAHALLDAWHTLILKVKKRSDFGGILAIGTAEAFFERTMDICKLVKYEEIIGKKFEIPLEAICCYSTNAISNLPLDKLITILNAHHSTMNGSRYKEWQPYRITELVRNGLERELGAELSNLILKTMKLCYKIGETEITANPVVLEEMLQRIMGKNAADVTLAHIKKEFRKFISL